MKCLLCLRIANTHIHCKVTFDFKYIKQHKTEFCSVIAILLSDNCGVLTFFNIFQHAAGFCCQFYALLRRCGKSIVFINCTSGVQYIMATCQ